jgi:nucleoside-diphosphate-sugar epimerase
MSPDLSDLQGRTVLLTGGSGFVGGYLASRLAAAGAQVWALVRQRGDHPGLESSNVTQIEGDFVDPATARGACAGAEIVVHSAATLGADYADAERVNVYGTAVLAAAAREAGCRRFVHISTISVYDWQAAGADGSEDAPLKVLGKSYAFSPAASPHYGLSKAEGERALRAEMERGLPATIFRLGAVLGVHPTSSWAMVVPERIRKGEVTLYNDGTDPLPWTHVENVWHAIELALARPESIGRAYNVVDGHVTMGRYVEDVRSWFPGAPPAPVQPRDPSSSPFVGRSAHDRLPAELGYAPLRTYEAGMAEAAAWWEREAVDLFK